MPIHESLWATRWPSPAWHGPDRAMPRFREPDHSTARPRHGWAADYMSYSSTTWPSSHPFSGNMGRITSNPPTLLWNPLFPLSIDGAKKD